jgi:hypothetical protein
MLATIFIWLSVAVIALGLADILLSKTQKEWLSNAVLKLWGALDEAKGWSFADWLKKPRAKWWFAVTVGLGLAILEAVFVFVWHDLFAEWRAQRRGTEPLKLDVFGRLFAALWAGAFVWAFIVYVTRPIFAWLLQFSSTKHLSNKLVISLLGASAALFLSTFFLDELLQGGGVYHVVGNILLTLTLPLGLLFLCAATIFISMAMGYAASGALYVGEFVVRRIAEYPKGPVLAISALFGGIAALIKAFGYD